MSEQPEPDVYDLYSQAVEIADPAQQDAFVQSRCHHNAELMERLRTMLAVRAEADSLFEQVAESRAAEWVDTPNETASLGKVGRFRLERLVGRGGMGNVFLGFDEQLQRPVALKFPRLDSMGNPRLLDRFLHEARLAAQLNHPNLVDIYEVGMWEQACFIASEWCEGGDLSTWLSEHPGPQDPSWSANLVRTIARAVAYCHQQGVVHLDIKPANIILSTQADSSAQADPAPLKPMLTDFGVARVIEEGMANTHTSLLMGTPLYMAPEQAECDRERIGPRSDVFSLGVILHELLYGRRPFQGDSVVEVIDQLRSTDTLILPVSKQVPRDLRTICQRCLEHEPEARYPSADALAEDLDRHLRGEPIHARPVGLLRRWSRWFERPERIVQAGVTAVVIQTLFLGELLGGLLAAALGWNAFIDVELSVMAWEFALIALCPHVPSLIVAIYTVRRKKWAVFVGTLLTLFTAGLLATALIRGKSPLSIYDNNLMALNLMHLLWLSVIMIQMAAYFAAIPAAFRLRRS